MSRVPLCAISLLLLAFPAEGLAQWHMNGTALCTASGVQSVPQVVGDGAGGAIIAWSDYRNGTADTYAQHVLASGMVDPAWPANGRALCTAPNHQFLQRVVADGSGGAIVVWADLRNGLDTDLYAQRVLASGVVDPAWPANGRAVCTAANQQLAPEVIGDGDGGAILIWQDYRSGFPDLYAQHVLSSGVVNPSWPGDGVAVCSSASVRPPQIVADGSGGAIVTWDDARSGSRDIYAQRVLAVGTVDPGWPANGRAICTAAEGQFWPQITGDAAGGAIVAWEDNRTATNTDIYAQRVLSSGTVDPAWPVDGRALCTEAGDQHSQEIVVDGAGGAIVIWQDDRSGSSDLYAHRVLSTGALHPSWPVNGRGMCTATGSQLLPQMIADGSGGAILTWEDDRTGAFDIYAHRILSSGLLDGSWPEHGRQLCVAVNDQRNSAILPDAAGGVIVAWEDLRSDAGDVYVQRVYGFGEVADAHLEEGPRPLQLLAPYPNPRLDGSIKVRFDLPSSRRASMHVYDLAGQRVRTLALDREFSAGRQILDWDGAGDDRAPLCAGVYFIRLHAGEHSRTQRIVLLD